MGLEFWKMTGAGNDFIVVNNRHGAVTDDPEKRADLVRRVCARRIGAGADGAILVEPSDKADFRMRFYNNDGGEAETCGNAARCIARFAHDQGIADSHMEFETMAGLYQADVMPYAVRVSMSDAHALETGIALEIENLFSGQADFVNTGVPHVILQVDDIDATPIVDLGRAVRYHERFAPAGTNVNCIAPIDPGSNADFAIRTYERGVEDETLACGTGCIAAAIVACRHGLAQSPVRLRTRSSLILTVHLEPTESGATNVELEGEARTVYRAELA